MSDASALLTSILGSLQPPRLPQRASAVMPRPSATDYAPGYNDHSTSDKWAALLGGLIPSLASLASRIVQGHQAQNAMAASRYQGDQLANLLSGPGPVAPSASLSAPVGAVAAPKADVPDPLAPLTGRPSPAKFDASPQGAMAYFTGKGYPKAVAAAIAGNFGPESAGWNPTAFNPTGGGQGAFGLGQWRGPRLRALKEFATAQGKPVSDPEVQFAFADHELQTSHRDVLQALNGVEDPGHAALIFSQTYERPGKVPASYTQRIAREGAQAFTGFVPPAPPPPDANGPSVQAMADSAQPAAAQAPAQEQAREALLHASPQEVAAFRAMYANPATREAAVKYATDLIKANASPDYEATVSGSQVIHYSKDPRRQASVESVPGVLGPAPANMMWDPQHPGRVIPIPGTQIGPPQTLPGVTGVYQREPSGHFQHMGEQPYGGTAPAPGVKSDPSLPPGAYRRAGVTGVWITAPSGKPERIADDGQSLAGTAGDVTKTGPDYLSTLPKAQATLVQALAEGRQPFPTGSALRSPYWQNMLQAVGQYDPTFDAVNYNARAKTRADFTAGKNGGTINVLNTSLNHLADFQQLVSKTAGLSGFPGATTLNAVGNAVLSSEGAPGIVTYKQTAGALAQELTRVYRQAGGAEGDVLRFMKDLDPNNSKEQKEAAIKNIALLLKGKLDALNDQYKQGMGTTATPLRYLTPKTQAFINSLEGGDARPKARQAPPPPKPGDIKDGYRFKGGNPADRNSWVKVQ